MRRKLKKLLSILTSRLVIIGLLILIQLAWFLILFLRLTQYATWINAGFVALSLLIELYIINKSGNPSYKILWLLFIGTFPVLGGLMYRCSATSDRPGKCAASCTTADGSLVCVRRWDARRLHCRSEWLRPAFTWKAVDFPSIRIPRWTTMRLQMRRIRICWKI